MPSGPQDTNARLQVSRDKGLRMPLAVCITQTHHSSIKAKPSHLFPSALHDFNGNGIDLVVHFNGSLFPTTHFYQQDAEICSSKIQGQEVTMFCHSQEHKECQKQLSASRQQMTPRLQTFKGGTSMFKKKKNGEAVSLSFSTQLRLREG